ncbi:MAG: hypothetical protein LC804_26450, partial [Acidobacteria bacterium]|nr:hypothetical protein [Acidobacteriota bacterium]
MSLPERALAVFPYAHALRGPIVVGLLLFFLPVLAFFSGARPAMSGLYDVLARGMLVVMLVAFTTAWTVGLSSWLILHHGWRREGRAASVLSSPTPFLIWSPMLALPTAAAAIVYSHQASGRPLRSLVVWTALGVLSAGALLATLIWAARRCRAWLERRSTRAPSRAQRLIEWLGD